MLPDSGSSANGRGCVERGIYADVYGRRHQRRHLQDGSADPTGE